MESKKGSGATNVGLASADISSHDHEGRSPRYTTQSIRGSIDLRRQSRSSLLSETTRSGSISCVNRQASGDDCAKQRFIVWAAVKRNRSLRMAASDRLRCPLLRCGEQFDDHETMLRHLNNCRHLEAGEYLCYECMRVEKFNDGKCKCCLGHQTKRRRIINAAKKVFSTLGHKSRKDASYEIVQDDFAIVSPPSYDSLDIEQEVPLPVEQEISGTPLSEMDGETVLPVELGSVNYEPQLDQRQPTVEKLTYLAATTSFLKPPAPLHTLQSLQNNNGSRPSLTLDTHNTGRPSKVPRTKYLSPSSSLRSNNGSQSIISPISAGSGMWTHGSTIDTTLASPITPFSSDVESASLSRENSCKFPKDYPVPSFLSNWDTQLENTTTSSHLGLSQSSDDFAINNLSELPGDIPLDMSVPGSWCGDPLLFSFGGKENYSWSSTVDTEVNVLFTGNDVHPDIESEAFGFDTKSFVGHTWDTLKEQMTFSRSNIRHIDNHLARQMEKLSTKDIVLKGLASLRSILSGVDPTDPLDYLCFIHVIYAFSIVIHEEDASSRVNKLFKQAQAYRGFLTAKDRDAYSAIVAALWEPESYEDPIHSVGRYSSLKGKEPELRANPQTSCRTDPLIDVAQNFLDDLEMSMLSESSSTRPAETMGSELYTAHTAEADPKHHSVSDAFSITVKYMVQILSQKFGTLSDSLRPKLQSISQRVTSGHITTIRRLELELLQTGKLTLPSTELFGSFIPEVRDICDPIYDQRGSNHRTKYHRLGIALVESLLQSIDAHNAPVPDVSVSTQEQQNASDFPLDLGDDSDALADFLKDFDNGAFGGENLFISPEPVLEDIISSSNIPTGAAAEPTTSEGSIAAHNTIDPATLSRTGSDTENTLIAK